MKGTWLLFFFETIVLALVRGNTVAFDDVIYIVLILIDSIVLSIELSKKGNRTSSYLIIALFLRLFFLFWVEYCSDIFLMPNTGYDEWKYYWNGYAHVVMGTSFSGYAGFISLLFDMVGVSKLFGSFVNLLLSMQTILIFKKIVDKLNFSQFTQNKAMLLICFMPNYALSSAILLRESIIIFFTAFSLLYFVRWWTDSRQNDLFFALLMTLPAIFFHTGMVAVTGGYICIAVSLRKNQFGVHLNLFSPKSLTLLTIAAIAGVLLLSQTGTEIGGVSSYSDIVQSSDVRIEGNSGYDANVFSNDSAVGFAANTPIHILYFLFSPLPWQWRGVGDVVAFFLSALIYGVILYKAIKEKSNFKYSALLKGMILLILFFLLIFGWGTANSGTALRHRDKAIVFYVLMYACLLETKLQSKLKWN